MDDGVVVDIWDGSYGVVGIDGIGAGSIGVRVWWYSWLPSLRVRVWALAGVGLGVWYGLYCAGAVVGGTVVCQHRICGCPILWHLAHRI